MSLTVLDKVHNFITCQSIHAYGQVKIDQSNYYLS